MSVSLFVLGSKADYLTFAHKRWNIRIQHITRNGSQHHSSSGKLLLSTSADFGSPWIEGMQTLHSDTCQKILKLHRDTATRYCSSTLVPHQCCSHHDGNWPPFNISGHGDIGNPEWDIFLTRKRQACRLSPGLWYLMCRHPTLLQVKL